MKLRKILIFYGFLFFVISWFLIPKLSIAMSSCQATEQCQGMGGNPEALCSAITNQAVCQSNQCCYWLGLPPALINNDSSEEINSEESESGPKLIIPELQINLPGLLFSDQNKIASGTDGEKTFFYVPWIGEYINWLYNYSIGIIALLAVIAIMIGGFYWLLAGGNASRVSEAKSWINAALSGLALALTSYLLLFTINSQLVSLPSIKMMLIKKIDIEIPVFDGGSESADNSVNIPFLSADCMDPCVPPSTLLSINNTIPGLSCTAKDCRVNLMVHQKLVIASQKARALGRQLIVTSANRSCAQQQALWLEYGENPKRVARPSCRSPHLSGSAVDITLAINNRISINRPYKIYPNDRQPYNQGDTSEVTLLKRIMIESGFVRYCREWWHFQVTPAAMPCYDPVR